ncbi:hypothetical protein DPMN_112757 [Dreissena polymorpha]|uniref:Uncharacterized protein n=1 Tax=Dreissena polymorpha TaxID=45954 RepID=A0A9D4KH41_DREPO|nr:hypothetical protein DPMN_112757 [Dreissena polymorpha]
MHCSVEIRAERRGPQCAFSPMWTQEMSPCQKRMDTGRIGNDLTVVIYVGSMAENQ